MKQLLRRPWGVILTVLAALVWRDVIPVSWILGTIQVLLPLILVIAVFKGRITRRTNRHSRRENT